MYSRKISAPMWPNLQTDSEFRKRKPCVSHRATGNVVLPGSCVLQMNTRGSQLRCAKDEASAQEKTGGNWETFLFGAIWPWNEASAEAILATRSGSAQVSSFRSTEREWGGGGSKVTQETSEWCQGAVNTSHLLLAARRSALSEITSPYFLLSHSLQAPLQPSNTAIRDQQPILV